MTRHATHALRTLPVQSLWTLEAGAGSSQLEACTARVWEEQPVLGCCKQDLALPK